MDELDAKPTAEELSKAIDSLASGKTPGNDWFLNLSEGLQYYSHSTCMRSCASAGRKVKYRGI